MIPIGLRAGLRFLTIVPLRYHEAESTIPPARTLVWFPAIGLVVGAAPFLLLLSPLPATVRAALALATWVAVTGGLHEDGFVDCADAAFAPVTPDRRREILKDPRIGAHGLTAGVLLLLLRYATLTAVPASAALVAPVLGRWITVLSLTRPWSAGTGGLAARFAEGASPIGATAMATVVIAALAAVGVPAKTLSVAAIVALFWGAIATRFLLQRLGGLNGDAHGAICLIAELAVLLVFVPIDPAGLG